MGRFPSHLATYQAPAYQVKNDGKEWTHGTEDHPRREGDAMTTTPTNTNPIQGEDTVPTPTNAVLRNAYEDVIESRQVLAQRKAEWERLQEGFEAEHEPLLLSIRSAKAILETAEGAAHTLAIAAYQSDPEHRKDVLPGCLGIREVKIVEFDDRDALVWALEHRVALALDPVAYKLLVQGGLAPGTVRTKLTATIARERKRGKAEG